MNNLTVNASMKMHNFYIFTVVVYIITTRSSSEAPQAEHLFKMSKFIVSEPKTAHVVLNK